MFSIDKTGPPWMMGLCKRAPVRISVLPYKNNPGVAMKKGLLFMILCFGLLSPFDKGFAEEPKEILSIEAYDMLNTVPDTFIIDVRTRPEYQFVGHPVGAYLFPYLVWGKDFQEKEDRACYAFDTKNKEFVNEISKVFQKTNNLLIICRDGTRSSLAAKELAAAGFKNVFNVTDGFEGASFPSFEDPDKHKFYQQLARRNKIHGLDKRRRYGWQWWCLPWTYQMDPKYIYPPDIKPPEAKK